MPSRHPYSGTNQEVQLMNMHDPFVQLVDIYWSSAVHLCRSGVQQRCLFWFSDLQSQYHSPPSYPLHCYTASQTEKPCDSLPQCYSVSIWSIFLRSMFCGVQFLRREGWLVNWSNAMFFFIPFPEIRDWMLISFSQQCYTTIHCNRVQCSIISSYVAIFRWAFQCVL